MATLVATRWNPIIKQTYEHLVRNGKVKKVALVACMRKLLTILNCMIRNNEPSAAHGPSNIPYPIFLDSRSMELEPKRKKVREKCSSRRASSNGCVFMTLPEYLQWLDWTGRQLKPGKRGAIPKNAPPILDRLNMSPEFWLHAVEHFSKRRTSNHITPASSYNAAPRPALEPVAAQ